MRIEYRIASGSTPDELTMEVNKLLDKGFGLAGSMQICQPTSDESFLEFYQPMFRPAGYKPLKSED